MVVHAENVPGGSIGASHIKAFLADTQSKSMTLKKKLNLSCQAYLQNVPLSYLKSIEDSYKKTFLPQIRRVAEQDSCSI